MILACLAGAARPASAQSATSLQIDATVLPRHTIGVRALTSFSRFDNLVGTGGTRNLGASLSTDSLGATGYADLANTEAAVRTLSGNNAFSVKAGQIVAAANSRVLTAPLILEYGLTSKLTFGVVVPLVETRTTVNAQFNKRVALANVALNPGAASTWSSNAALVSSLTAAAAALQAQLTACQTNPSGSGCATLLAQQSAVTALINSTAPFASALQTLYGTSETNPGRAFVPISGTAAQYQINDRIDSFRTQYAQFSQTISTGNPAAAPAQSARAELQKLLMASGYDSLQSRDRSSIGDISIGATYQLVNTFTDSARANLPGRLYRVSINATGRIGTGEPYSRNKLFDNATGYGQPGAIVGAAADIRFTPRFYLSGIGSYMKQLGTIDVARVANSNNTLLPIASAVPGTYTAGDEMALTLIPRYRIGGLFSIDGIYSLKHVGPETYTVAPPPSNNATLPITIPPHFGADAATGHVVGFGFTYSSSLTDRGPGRLPYEASFRHTETIAANGGPIAKTFTDQIQLRVFLK